MGHRRTGFQGLFYLVLISQFLFFSAPHAAPALGDVLLAFQPALALLSTPITTTPMVREMAGPTATPSLILRATAYNSLVEQTNSEPFITATGARTRWGIIAVSRDLLSANLPYGSLVRLTDLGTFASGRGAGAYQGLLDRHVFIVEDTMHPRKTQQIDIWFAEYAHAVTWGVRRLRVDVVRYGRLGPLFDPAREHDFVIKAPITFLAAN